MFDRSRRIEFLMLRPVIGGGPVNTGVRPTLEDRDESKYRIFERGEDVGMEWMAKERARSNKGMQRSAASEFLNIRLVLGAAPADTSR